jgi:IgA Peptidase M64
MTRQDGDVLGAVRVVDHGRPASRWNLVILSEGYTRADLDAGIFVQDVENLTAAMFAAVPFDEPQVQGAINVWRVDVASDERGADDPGIDPATRLCLPGTGIKVRTYFDATFCGAPTDKPQEERIHRALAVNNATVLAVADEQVPEWHQVLVFVNTTTRGGLTRGGVPVLSKTPDMFNLALHELGHGGFGLADEYDNFVGCESDGTALDPDGERDRYPAEDGEPVQPNVTIQTNRASLKWRQLIAATTPVPTTTNADCTKCDRQASPVPAGTVGLFEGADYYHCGAYRPEFSCRMRNAGGANPFCAVCRARIRETLRPYMPGRKRMDYTVISEVRQHFGNERDFLDGVFAGQKKDFKFDCPGIDSSQRALLMLQTLNVGGQNVFEINGQTVFGGLPRTTDSTEAWSAQVLVITPGTLHSRDNVLHVESRTDSGSASGDIDDFVIDNVVVLYKTD